MECLVLFPFFFGDWSELDEKSILSLGGKLIESDKEKLSSIGSEKRKA